MAKLSKEFKKAVKAKQSAYAFFKAEKIATLNLTKKPTKEQIQAIKDEWAALDADLVEGYKQRAKEDGDRYEKEKEEFLKTHDSIYDKNEKNGKKPTDKAAKAKTNPVNFKFRKPTTAKVFFALTVRHKVKQENPQITKAEVSNEIQRRWEALNPVDRMIFVNKENRAKADYDKKLEAFLSAHGQEGPPPVTLSARKSRIQANEASKSNKKAKLVKQNDENSNTANITAQQVECST